MNSRESGAPDALKRFPTIVYPEGSTSWLCHTTRNRLCASTTTRGSRWSPFDHPTDVTEDYDYTDWDAVERFGRAYAALLA